ncbi:MAG: peptidoglycan DD-metalloendopeptidase family protein [Gemmatimonadales bacterium]
MVGTYAAGDPTRQGIDIAGEAGQPVRAARDGEVVYSGAGLIGYGELIIVKHSPELLSAYGHNRVRLVKEGDKVKAGQKIAEMGKNAANRVLLHFEVRKNGKPVDPLPLLPAR